MPQFGVVEERLACKRLGAGTEQALAPRAGEPTTIIGIGPSNRRSASSPAHGPRPSAQARMEASRCKSTSWGDASISSARSDGVPASDPSAEAASAGRTTAAPSSGAAVPYRSPPPPPPAHHRRAEPARPRTLRSRAAGGVQHHASPTSLEKREAQLLLEPADLLAGTALCVRCSAEAAARRFCISPTARKAVSVLRGGVTSASLVGKHY